MIWICSVFILTKKLRKKLNACAIRRSVLSMCLLSLRQINRDHREGLRVSLIYKFILFALLYLRELSLTGTTHKNGAGQLDVNENLTREGRDKKFEKKIPNCKNSISETTGTNPRSRFNSRSRDHHMYIYVFKYFNSLGIKNLRSQYSIKVSKKKKISFFFFRPKRVYYHFACIENSIQLKFPKGKILFLLTS